MISPQKFWLLAPLAAVAAIASAAGSTESGSPVNRLEFTAHPIDTRQGIPAAPSPFSSAVSPGPGLQLVQFDGPIRQAWLDALAARSVTPVQYVASNGYLVWADEAGQAQLAALRRAASWLRYAAAFQSFLKVDPALASRLVATPTSSEEVDITVQIYAHSGDGATRRFVEQKAIVPTAQRAPLGSGAVGAHWVPVLKFVNLDLRVRLSDIPALAERTDAVFVGLNRQRVPMDEKQGLILSGNMMPGPAAPSYRQFLLDRGFSPDPTEYPIVDVTDSPVDEGGSGVTVLDTIDPFLHEQGNLSQPARVAYFNNCSALPDAQVGAADGHGSLNAGILAGDDRSTGYPYQDADGQRLGLGINPFARIGSTAIFVGDPLHYDVSGCGNSDAGILLRNWQSGARISTNSWGTSPPSPVYDPGDQAYDAGVRDADQGAPGNQELITVFAAANAGPDVSTVTSPGAAKNVITVGASQNLRPFPPPPDNRCLSGADPADDPENVADFSSRGPAPGQRVKPELIAPGTHIQAGASVYSGYSGSGLCVSYYPENPPQRIFTYSTGTSHSTPAVAGVASLAYWWIEHGGAGMASGAVDEIGGARPPSPAAMKAWLIAHPTYLTGIGANDDLPSDSQGYGMPNTSDMFDATPKVLLDQSEVFDNTGESRSYLWRVADPTKPVRVALAYTDAPGLTGTSPQVNDLDLKVEINGQTYLGNHFDHQWSITGGSPDTKNNYEAVFMPAGVSGDMTITVAATNIAGDGVPNYGDATDQDFALVCSNCVEVPTFDLAVTPSTLPVCAGSAQTATLHLTSVAGFADPITLSAIDAPTGSVAFIPNPATPPGDALAIFSVVALATGDYPTTLVGSGGGFMKNAAIDLHVSAAPPGGPALSGPANEAVDVDTSTTFAWSTAPDAVSYTLDIATDPTFDNLVDSLPGLNATSTTIRNLAPLTTYYWRVTAVNVCGGGVSASARFTTANEICHAPQASIPDDDPNGIGDAIVVDDPSTLASLRLRIKATHPYVGDLQFTLAHSTGSSVVIDRPGVVGSGYGCNGQNIDVLLDEAASTSVQDQCGATPPAIAGTQQPAHPIDATFAGQAFAGAWTLTAADLAPGEAGTLDEWCLQPDVPRYTIGGTINGLSGSAVTLSLNGGAQTLVAGSNGSFVFPVAQAGGSVYAVVIAAQPVEPPQNCTIANGNGTVGSANVTTVAIRCNVETIFADGFEG